eukprot:Protomagalhaensia_sp_Gyna_25__1850@NODE_1980_length_1368_cov_45_305493_g1630_i0_p1_GENE_NODE_1980_length_1368_cov_45_305493_g1630_i0NODE_1980_length_1368_cov_45_305493_g1630_i0_p1_ORF_typecomplete_len294_score40_09_NODE_1980_length_1368_cov_45_305493_g1630_i02041085
MDTTNLSDHLSLSRISPRLPDECQSETSVPRPRRGRKRSSVSVTERDDSDLESYRGRQFSTSTSDGRKMTVTPRFTLLRKDDASGGASDPRSIEPISPQHSILDISDVDDDDDDDDDQVSKLGSSVYGDLILEPERFYAAGQTAAPDEKNQLFQRRDLHTMSTDTSSAFTYQSHSFVRMASSRVEDFKADVTEEGDSDFSSEEAKNPLDAALHIVPIHFSSELASFDPPVRDDGLEIDNQEDQLIPPQVQNVKEMAWPSASSAKPSRKLLISLLTCTTAALAVGTIIAFRVIS